MKITRKMCLYSSIWLITLVPVLIAWSMAYFEIGLPDSTRNNGTLISLADKVPSSMQRDLNNKWGLLVISEGCESPCQQQLFRMQQLHKLMGKNYGRLQTLWLSSSVLTENTKWSFNIDLSSIQQLHDTTLLNWFKQQKLPWQDHSIWLIDPLGNLVMRFPPELSGRQILDDLNWLMVASRIG